MLSSSGKSRAASTNKSVILFLFFFFLILTRFFNQQGTVDSLMHHMLEENALDTTFIEDFLLTYRAFSNEPLRICKKLLEWFDNEIFRSKVRTALILLSS